MKRVAAALAVAAGLTGLLLGARDGGQASAQAAVKRAAAKTVDAGSSRFRMTWQVPQLPQEFDLPTIEGTMDYVHHRGRIVYSRDNEMLFDGNVTYMKWPMPWRERAAWLRQDGYSDESDPLNLQDRATHNPIGLLGFLAGASNDVRVVGTEPVRGTSTTHYEGTLDLQKVVDQEPPDKRAELQNALDFIAEDEATTVPFGLWADGEGVAHRLRVDEQGAASVTIEYYDFGVPVEITPPPASEILSADEFFKEMEQHANDGCDGNTDSTAASSADSSGTGALGEGTFSTTGDGMLSSSTDGSNDNQVWLCVESTSSMETGRPSK